MRHRLLGRSGLRVSEVALGTLTFGESKEWGADPDEAAAILHRFLDAGGTFVDTAPNYANGAAETIVGTVLAERRDEIVLATKYTASQSRHMLAGGNSRRSMIRSVEDSLKRLRTDHLDLLWLHYWDGTTPLDEILRGFDDLARSGKILYAGLSDTSAWLASRAATMAELRGLLPVAALQLEYNVAARTAEHELLPMARALDLGVVCWGPLAAGGLLQREDARRVPAQRVSERVRKAGTEIDLIRRETGISAAALALRWTMRDGAVPIIGARTAAQLDATLDALETPVPPELLDHLDQAAPPEAIFPHALIESDYLRRLALGAPDRIELPARPRC